MPNIKHSTDEVPDPKVGERIAQLRKNQGLTQEALAGRLEELGWRSASKFAVYKLEVGSREIDTHELAILARALECQVGDLFGETERRGK
ncbi:MAG: helix-turn-helix transcriptional regulator [Verrucomicrobiota bacterium]